MGRKRGAPICDKKHNKKKKKTIKLESVLIKTPWKRSAEAVLEIINYILSNLINDQSVTDRSSHRAVIVNFKANKK